MGDSNKVTQQIKLDASDYRTNLILAARESSQNLTQIAKALSHTGGEFSEFSNKVKKESLSLGSTMGDLKKSFVGNLGVGLAVGVGTAAVSELNNQLKESVRLGMSFGKAMAHYAARADLSPTQRRETKAFLLDQAKTGVDMDSLPGALGQLHGANGGNHEAAKAVIPEIAKVAGAEGIGADTLTSAIISRLKTENRPLDKKNIDSLLQSYYVATRHGEFANITEAIGSMGSETAAAKGRAGMTDREHGALTAAVSQSGQSKEKSVGALQALMGIEDEGFGPGAALRGFLGGPQKKKGEKYNFSDYGKMAEGYQKKISSGQFNENQMITMFQGMNFSKDQAEGFNAIMRDFKTKVAPTYSAAMKDDKSVDTMVDQTNKNASHTFKSLKNRFVGGAVKVGDFFLDNGSVDRDVEKKGDQEDALHKSISKAKSGAPSWSDFKAAFGLGPKKTKGGAGDAAHSNESGAAGGGISHEAMASAVAEGVVRGMEKAKPGHSKVEIHSVDPAFKAIPKASDNPRNPKGP